MTGPFFLAAAQLWSRSSARVLPDLPAVLAHGRPAAEVLVAEARKMFERARRAPRPLAGTSPSPRTHTAGRARRRCRRRRGRLPVRRSCWRRRRPEARRFGSASAWASAGSRARRLFDGADKPLAAWNASTRRARSAGVETFSSPRRAASRSIMCRRRRGVGQAKSGHAPIHRGHADADRSARWSRCCRFAGSSRPPGRAATATASVSS